jgi:hypothetical protein
MSWSRYQHIFGKVLDAHNAAADAQMTMELYNWWIKQGRPARGALGGGTIQPARNCAIGVKWYNVEARAVHKEMARESGKGGHGTAPFTLRFRSEPERAAYLHTLRQKIARQAATSAGDGSGGGDGGGGLRWDVAAAGWDAAGELLIRCGSFELLVSDEAR